VRSGHSSDAERNRERATTARTANVGCAVPPRRNKSFRFMIARGSPNAILGQYGASWCGWRLRTQQRRPKLFSVRFSPRSAYSGFSSESF
jgi:hypothetical protein